jgi:hypothetical protein
MGDRIMTGTADRDADIDRAVEPLMTLTEAAAGYGQSWGMGVRRRLVPRCPERARRPGSGRPGSPARGDRSRPAVASGARQTWRARRPAPARSAATGSPSSCRSAASIVPTTADGLGTNEIVRRTGRSKPRVWRRPQGGPAVAGVARHRLSHPSHPRYILHRYSNKRSVSYDRLHG